MNVHERFKHFEEKHCWQYEVRQQNLSADLEAANLTEETASSLQVADFDFSYVNKTDKEGCQEVKRFIERHEWLGKLPNRPTHRFTARLRGNTGPLAGVVVMAVPNAFSKLLGDDTQHIEKLVSRGACISWSPKNLASWLIMKSVRWMVKNTDFRLFTAYSDPEAKELGTVYQAANWIYLGKTSGTSRQYFDPTNEKAGWFSDREFRKKSKYQKYALSLGLTKEEWKKYMKKYSPNWDLIAPELKIKLKQKEREYRESCLMREVPAKHKYCYILGRSKGETKRLLKRFKELNPKRYNLPYPKERGE